MDQTITSNYGSIQALLHPLSVGLYLKSVDHTNESNGGYLTQHEALSWKIVQYCMTKTAKPLCRNDDSALFVHLLLTHIRFCEGRAGVGHL